MCNWYYQNIFNKNIKNYNYITSNDIKKYNTITPETDQTPQYGFLNVHLSNPVGEPISNAIISLFILDRLKGETPIQAARTNEEGNILGVTVPVAYNVAYDIGTNYFLTSYNLRADAYGYYSYQVNNLRFYPGVTTELDITLHPILINIPGINLEQRVLLPPSKFD